MRFKEVLNKMGIGGERELEPFEKARKAIEESGGRELIIRVAEELKKGGDSSVIVEEEKPAKDSSTNTCRLTLRYGMQKDGKLPDTRWESKAVSIVAGDTGHIDVELSLFPGKEPISLKTTSKIVATWGRGLMGRYVPPIKPEEMLLEEQFRLAMELANPTPDFRYGEGEQSLKQKLVKSEFLKRIF